jgi:hypothetical protein
MPRSARSAAPGPVALVARRDLIVKLFDERIASVGEENVLFDL